MSEQYTDNSAGINGGFEVSENGLPVNWLLYSPNTVPEGTFTILLDTVNPFEGKQSLKFDVQSCSPEGGWLSPGFTRQFDVEKASVYKLSCWIRNSGAEFTINAGGVSNMSGDMVRIARDKNSYDEWTAFEYIVPISEAFNQMRIEVNIVRPGIFWIDELRIEKQ